MVDSSFALVCSRMTSNEKDTVHLVFGEKSQNLICSLGEVAHAKSMR